MEHSQADALAAMNLRRKVFVPRRLCSFGTSRRPRKRDVVDVDGHVRIHDGWGRPSDKADLVPCGKVRRPEVVRLDYR